MRAGLLNKIIEIYNLEISDSDFGCIEPSYSLNYTTRAQVKYNSGNRQFENNEVFFENNTTFTIRKYVPVKLTSRIKYNGQSYRILSIEESDSLNNKTIITELIND